MSSTRRRILRKASSSLLFRSPSETSNTRPFSPSDAILVPAVRDQGLADDGVGE